jgi:hypothetical protein
LPSKAIPINSPFPFNTGEPELPPVISLLLIKPTGRVPFSAYLPKFLFS